MTCPHEDSVCSAYTSPRHHSFTATLRLRAEEYPFKDADPFLLLRRRGGVHRVRLVRTHDLESVLNI
jgi:hypothetical protein